MKTIVKIIVIGIVIYGAWFTFIDFNIFFPILLREEHHLNATFEPNDLTLYKSLIPKEFEMPEHPEVKVDFVQVTPAWHECYVSMKVNYEGKPTWHALSWAIDTYVPYVLGRWVGYPKFMADSMVYSLDENSVQQHVIKEGKLFMSMEYKKTEKQEHHYCAKDWDNQEIYHLLSPPLEGPQINRLTFEYLSFLNPSEYIEQHGDLLLHINQEEPWARLISDNGERSVDAIYFKRETTELLWLYAKKVR